MPDNTPVLGLYKKNPATDGNDTFNITTMLNDNWDAIDQALGRPFFLSDPTYDAANDRIVCVFSKGIAELFNGDNRVIVEKSDDTTYYINAPAINTTYYLFLQQDGTFTHNTTGAVPAGGVLLYQIAVGAAKATLTKTDRRYLISGVGAKLAGHIVTVSSETVVGHVELATAAEVTTGTDTARAVTPAGAKVELDKKVNHSLATAANDFLVASGVGVFIKKTLAEVKTILGLGTAAYTASSAYATAAHTSVAASESTVGHVELATAAEVTTGTDTARAVTPAGAKVELDKKSPLASPTFTTKITTPIIDLTSGQIKFPAAQSASADVNTLDDYEEGNWTPQLGSEGTDTGQTFLSATGRYVKIGKVVTLYFAIDVTTIGTLGGTYACIKGLPFACGSYPNGGSVTIDNCTGLASNVVSIAGYVSSTGTVIWLTSAAAASVSPLDRMAKAVLANSVYISGACIYYV